MNPFNFVSQYAKVLVTVRHWVEVANNETHSSSLQYEVNCVYVLGPGLKKTFYGPI